VSLLDRNPLILLMSNFQNGQENLIWAGFSEFSHSQDPTRTLTLACVDIVERRGLASSSRPFVLDIHDRHGLDREADFHPAWGV
jgi:hypothetical protein